MALVNNLKECVAQDRVCKAVFLKLIPTPQSVLAAKQAGFDSLLIDLEHTTLSLTDASTLCMTGLAAGVTPIVRVPYECGDGFVQRILDNGAMGIVFPHCDGIAGAKKAVRVTKFPPFGRRSCGAHFPQFNCATLGQDFMMPTLDQTGSMAIVMCETVQCLDEIDGVAAVEGVDGILIGTFDLSIELGILGDWQNPKLKEALEKVGNACKKHGKIFGVAGLNHLPEVLSWVMNTLGARFVVGKGDMAIVTDGMKASCDALSVLENKK